MLVLRGPQLQYAHDDDEDGRRECIGDTVQHVSSVPAMLGRTQGEGRDEVSHLH